MPTPPLKPEHDVLLSVLKSILYESSPFTHTPPPFAELEQLLKLPFERVKLRELIKSAPPSLVELHELKLQSVTERNAVSASTLSVPSK